MVSRKRMLIMFGTVLLAILLSNIFGYSDNNYKPKYGTTTSNVNFRTTANTSASSKIKIIKKGTNLKMVGEASGFYIVQLVNNEVGLISKSYIKTTTTSLSASKVYTNLSKYYATVNSNSTNVRGGPSTSFKSYTKLSKGSQVQVIGKIDNWNLIVTSNNLVGMIRSDLITKTSYTAPNNSSSNTSSTPTISSNVKTIINLINEERKKNNLSPYTIDAALNNVAQTKSNDMVKNNYFSHTSPNYGTPFKMMQGFGITYKTAGENIAGNPSLKNAVTSWMASEGHKKNILSKSYNYIGVGVTSSSTYGYVITAMFIQK